MTVILEVTPARHIGTTSGLMGAVFTLSSILGPIVGGAITTTTTWRWVFYFNIPPGAAIIVLVILIFPANVGPLPISRQTLAYVDYPGIILSLAGSVLLIFGLEQGGTVYQWTSSAIVAAFTFAGFSFTAFALWEWMISYQIITTSMLPVFPARLITRRVFGSIILTAFLTGFPFMVTIVFIPQRFQIQNGLRPIDAGIRVLALLLASAFGAGLGGAMSSVMNIPWHTLVASLGLQILGLGLMSSLPTSSEIIGPQYVYQVILGLGFGLALSSLAVMIRVEAGVRDVALAVGALAQVRVLGGVVGVAIAQSLLNSVVENELSRVLDQAQIDALRRSVSEIHNMTAAEAAFVRESYSKAFNLQSRTMMYFAMASFLLSFLVYRRDPVSLKELRNLQNEERDVEITDRGTPP
ncbi:MAG: hypothetical protein M1839_008386 [Geoglossum umbratile]|nr:MAG: hypothetical protein M1839_008386 [Geoglossum umbratile]